MKKVYMTKQQYFKSFYIEEKLSSIPTSICNYCLSCRIMQTNWITKKEIYTDRECSHYRQGKQNTANCSEDSYHKPTWSKFKTKNDMEATSVKPKMNATLYCKQYCRTLQFIKTDIQIKE